MQSKNNKSKTTKTITQKGDEQTTNLTQPLVVAVENANKIVEDKLQGQVVEVKKGGNRGKTTQVLATKPEVQVQVQTETQLEAQVETQPEVQVQVQVQSTSTKSKKTKVVKAEVVQAEVVETVKALEPVVQVVVTKGKKRVAVSPVAQAQAQVQEEVQNAQEVQVAGAKTKKVLKTKSKSKVQRVEQVDQVEQVEKVEQEDADIEEEQVGGKLRYFKLYYNNENKGRYCGKKPKQAANKAFSSIIKELNNNGQNEGINVDINFSIKECTRHSKHKEYKYTGKRLALVEPVPVYIPHAAEVVSENIKEEKLVSSVPIKQKKVQTLHSGREVVTNGGSIYLLSDNGLRFKKIIYHFHNKIQKAPKAVIVPVANA
jgi:hypothetical protein